MRYLILTLLLLKGATTGYLLSEIAMRALANGWLHGGQLLANPSNITQPFRVMGVLLGAFFAWVTWRVGLRITRRTAKPT